MIRRILTFSLLAALALRCSAPREKITTAPVMDAQGTKPVIYQIMVRLFSNTKSTNKPFGTIAENGAGKFEEITAPSLDAIRKLGVSHIWYTGVIEHASLSAYPDAGIMADDPDVVKGIAGSPYAIRDYYDVDPDLAVDVRNRMLEFERLVDRTHQAGMKVIIDFVPNHVARNYHSDSKPDGVTDLGASDDSTKAFSPSNNFYYLPGQRFKAPTAPKGQLLQPGRDGAYTESPARATGNDRFVPNPSVDDWYETIKLNYGVDVKGGGKTYFDQIPDTWNKMRDILVFWAGKKVDGFRCDMVQMVPVDFWRWVIPQVKAVNPDLIFIGEIYEPAIYRTYLNDGRFDYLYDKVGLYDNLRAVIQSNEPTTRIPLIRKTTADLGDHLVHFMENHDEQRIASPQFAGDYWRGIPAMAVSALIDKGAVMMYFGQESGEAASGATGFKGDDGRTTMYDYWGVTEHQKWMNFGKFDGAALSPDQQQLHQYYEELLKVASSNVAIVNGDFYDLTEDHISRGLFSNRVAAFARIYGDERLIILANFNTKDEHVKIQLTDPVIAAFGLEKVDRYLGRDLLRSGTEVALDASLTFEVDVPRSGAMVLKIK